MPPTHPLRGIRCPTCGGELRPIDRTNVRCAGCNRRFGGHGGGLVELRQIELRAFTEHRLNLIVPVIALFLFGTISALMSPMFLVLYLFTSAGAPLIVGLALAAGVASAVLALSPATYEEITRHQVRRRVRLGHVLEVSDEDAPFRPVAARDMIREVVVEEEADGRFRVRLRLEQGSATIVDRIAEPDAHDAAGALRALLELW